MMDERWRVLGIGVLSLCLSQGCGPKVGEGCAGFEFENDAGSPSGAVWTPAPGTTWHWQLTGTIDTNVDVEMVDVDLFDTPDAVIEELHEAGRIVICYFSAGSYEEWRDDAGDFDERALGKTLDGWNDERWLDVRCPSVQEVVESRLDLAQKRGCDGVEPDNVDGYDNKTGFDFSSRDQLAFNRWIADAAHARGLSVGLKNDLDQVAALEPSFDWALNEECVAYNECSRLSPFIGSGKAVFHAEYVDRKGDGAALRDRVCGDLDGEEFSTIIKEWDLTAWGLSCEP